MTPGETVPALGLSILKLELVPGKHNDPLSVGNCNHPTIVDLEVTDKGRELIKQLRIDTNIPDFPFI